MSIRWMSAIYKAKLGMGPATKLVALKLADNANDDGACYPSLAKIAADTELCERQVRYSIRKLEKAGIIRVKPGGRKPRSTGLGGTRTRANAYRFQEGALERLQGGKECPHEGARDAPTRGQGMPPNHQSNHQSNRQKKARAVENPPPNDLDSGQELTLATTTATTLEGWGLDPAEVAERMTDHYQRVRNLDAYALQVGKQLLAKRHRLNVEQLHGLTNGDPKVRAVTMAAISGLPNGATGNSVPISLADALVKLGKNLSNRRPTQ